MVAIFTGAGTGFERGSGNVLGGAGLLGQAGIGRSGEQVMLNAANGNVLIMQQDELLLGRGPDAAVSRTYNSQGDLSDENGDNWRQSTDRRIFGLTGTVNSVGSTVRRTSADGSVVTYRYDGTAYETTDGAGAHDVVAYLYDRHGNLTRHTDANGQNSFYYYDALGRKAVEVDATGAYVTYAYNGLGLVTSKTEATGDTVLYNYDRVGRLVEEQRPDLISNADDDAILRVAYFYDGVDNLVRVVEGYDRVTTNRYDAMGRKTATVDAMGSERSFHYDRAGNLIGEAYSRRNSAGTLLREGVTYRYDAVGRLRYQNLAIWTAQNGVATNWVNVGDYADITYNAFGEVASRAVNGKVQERHDYDAAGRVWRSTGGDGVSRYFVHDGAGRQTLVLESDGGVDLQNRTLGDVLTLAAVNGTLAGGPETGIVATISQYDRRGQAIATRSPRRELNGGASGVTDLLTTRSYTAFGEVTSETDARGASIHYAYNRMGRVVAITRPTVVVVGEDGQTVSRAPVEERYYDISGRLVGARDANGNLSTRILAAGTGYEGAAELVTGEYHADGGRVWLRYDDAGNLVRRNDELNRATLMEYDKLGRLLTTSNLNARDVAHSYTYDSLGRRLTHSQTGRGADDIEKTDYDIGGRVVSTRAFGGDVTTTSYSWDSSITSGLGAAGGWRQTTTYANGKTTVEYKDTFGRITRRTDMGGNSATTSFDQAGRVARITGLEEQTFVWFNTGQLASQTSDMGSGEVRSAATFGYEPGGNIIAETFTRDGVLYRNTTAAFDLQGRMTSWAEVGNGSVPAASTQWSYDANGNIRSTASKRALLDQQGAVIASGSSETAWFRYDSMSRMTLDGGQMVAGVLQRANGTEITYRVDGSRATSTSSVYLTGTAYFWEPTPGQDPLMPVLTGPDEGGYQAHTVSYLGERRETYSWRDDGQLQSVAVADTGYIDNGDGTLTSTGDFTRSGGSATYDYDALGRQTRQVDRNEAGSAVYDRQVAYDTGGRGLIASETVVTIQQGGGTVTTSTTNDYGVGADYVLGAVRQATVGSTVRSGGTTTTTSTTTTNSYQWRDGAVLLRSVTSKAGVADSISNYGYSGVGQLETVSIGGTRPRTVTFVTDLAGQVIRRDEADATYSTGDPHEIWYRHGGREIGHITNNGSAADTYGESIVLRGLAPGDGPFMTDRNPPRGSAFAETIDRINSYETGGSARSYTVQGGETLAGIAAQLWGDSSLWYKLASANSHRRTIDRTRSGADLRTRRAGCFLCGSDR